MADIRCPMCGKDNPDHLETCQYCSARLTPLQSDAPPPEEHAADGADDWLMALRANDNSGEQGDDEEVPDWLRDLDPADEAEPAGEETLEDDAPEQPDVIPDWLEETLVNDPEPVEFPEPEKESPAAVDPEPEEETALPAAELETDELSPSGETIDLPNAEEADEDEDVSPRDTEADVVPDWLADLAPVEDAEFSETGLDWLAELGGETEVSGAASAAGKEFLDPGAVGDLEPAELPDWLSEIKPPSPVDTPAVEMEETPGGALADADNEGEAPLEDVAIDLPDWLSEFEEITDGTETEEQTPVAETLIEASDSLDEEEVELPDWLTDLEVEETEAAVGEADSVSQEDTAPVEDAPLPEPEPVAEQDVDVPAWLADLVPDGPEETGPEEVEIPAAEQHLIPEDREESIPDWLLEFDTEDAEAPVSEAGSESLKETAPVEDAPLPEAEPVAEQDVDVPAWLADLVADEPEETGPEEAEVPAAEQQLIPEDSEEATPDWLLEFDTEEAEVPADDADIDSPEEMTPIEESPFTEAEPTAEQDVDVPAWFADLVPGGAEEPGEEQAEMPSADPPTLSEESEEAMPEWLAALTSEDATEPELETIETQAFEEERQPEIEDQAETEQDALPDWLSEIEAAEPEEETPAFAEPIAGLDPVDELSETDMPDWLTEVSGERDFEEETEPLPDWLREMETPASGPPEEDEPAETEAPEWLQEFDKQSGAEALEEAYPDEDPEWMDGFVSDDDEEGDQPDWLDDLPHVQEEGISQEKEDPPSWLEEQEDDVPAWLTSALGAESIEQAGDVLHEPEPIEEDLVPDIDDWLKNLSAESQSESDDESIRGQEADKDSLDVPTQPSSAALPNWLEDLQDQSIGEAEVDSGLWDRPAALQPESDLEKTEEEPDAIDWMPGQESELSIDMLASGEGIEEGLAPGELPSWLKEMQPNDAAMPGMMEAGEQDSGSIESTGPLAGLRGVLSAEPTVSQVGRTPANFVRLQVSEMQQLKADQLERMIRAEMSPSPARRKPMIPEQRLLRYIIAAVLFLVVALPLLLPGSLAALPPKLGEMNRLDRLIGLLSQDSHVLVAFDYQPGMSGEMDAAASSVLDHLLLQNTKLALVSTQVTGPALGERFIRIVESQHGYKSGGQYVNLGYLPGDSTGLQLFASDPMGATKLGYDDRPLWAILDQEANDPWQQPALKGVENLIDFDLTLLISDNPDTIRRWLEQVSPALRPRSLIVVSSAQAEALVLPYVDSAQSNIAAFVPGLSGGASYEGFLQRNGPARDAWDAYSLGSLFAIILMLGAGTYNLYILWKEREAKGDRK